MINQEPRVHQEVSGELNHLLHVRAFLFQEAELHFHSHIYLRRTRRSLAALARSRRAC